MKWLRRLLRAVWLMLLVVILVGLLLPVAAVGLLATEPGTRWVLQQAPQWLRPVGVELRLGEGNGALLQALELRDLEVDVDGLRIAAERLQLQWRPQALLVGRLDILALQGSGLVVTLPPADATAAPAPAGPPVIPELAVPILVRIAALDVSGLTVLQGDDATRIERLSAKVILDPQRLAVDDLAFVGLGLGLNGDVAMAGTAPHTLSGHVRLQVDGQVTGPDVGAVVAYLGLSGAALQPALALRVRQPAELMLDGTLDLTGVEPGFDLDGAWSRIGWPLVGKPQVMAKQGRLSLAGVPGDYRLRLRTTVSGDQVPPANLDLVLSGDTESVRIDTLGIDVLDGRIDIDGPVTWLPAVSWELRATIRDIDPQAVAADWPGRLGGRIRVDGGLNESASPLRLHLAINELAGTLRGYPLRAKGEVRVRDDVVVLNGIELLSDANRIGLNGSLGERLDAALTIDAPRLDTLYPDAAGTLQGQAQIGGTRKAPTLVAEMRGEALGFADARVASLDLDVTWREDKVEATALLTDVASGDAAFDRLQAQVVGSVAEHQATLVARGPALALAATARGGLVDAQWRGSLQQLALTETPLGDWQLQQPTKLVLGEQHVDIGRLCLAHQAESLCAEGAWRKQGKLQASGRVTALDLNRLAIFLPGEGVIDGLFDAQFDIGGTVQAPTVQASLVPRDGTIRVETDEQPIALAYRDVEATARFENDRGELSFRLQLDQDGTGSGQLRLGAAREQGRKLSGQMKIEFPDLSLVAGFVPVLTDVTGGLRLDAQIRGTTLTPRVAGRMTIDSARATVAPAGITLDDINIALDGDGTGPLTLQGSIRSGEGTLKLDGRLSTAADEAMAVDLRIGGERFQAVQLPEAVVLVSPDLRLRGQGDYRLTGVLRVPEAHIEIKALPAGTVSVSPDEIIVGETVDAAAAPPANLSGNVRVELGDKVSFKGFGLATGLTGAIVARFDHTGNQVDGKIEMRDGEYKSYGQDLTIEQGRLLFAGPPEQPDVDLRAMRLSRDGEVKAYLAMSGPLTQPRPRIYSEPALPESEALAYLVTGRGLNQAGEGDNLDIAAAAFSLGVSQGEPWLHDLSDQVGLDDLRVETGETLEESSLLLGKYLNPDLYVGYTQELFNPEGAVLVRLRLNKMFEVETRSGSTQSVDLFYRFEHN